MLVAISLNLLSTVCQHTIGRLLPINVNRFPFFHQQTVMDDDDPQDYDPLPPPPDPARSTTDRTFFDTTGCTIYGYPSTGGVLIKEANLVDMLFLSLPRSHVSYRSLNTDEEDRFCSLMKRTGATLEEEEKVMVYGWPTDGVGVWILRFKNTEELPRDFGRINLAMNMEEKIQIMREFGATFVEDVMQVEELN
ncbi:hypothetical protein BDV37DRAFT_252750, partial [Aspergillus pseudonomiae]